MSKITGNRDKCGRCKTNHGGNDHYCPVHGPVSKNCCPPGGCNPDKWVRVLYYGWVNHDPVNNISGHYTKVRILTDREIVSYSDGRVCKEMVGEIGNERNGGYPVEVVG